MESNCEERKKREEIKSVVKEVISRGLVGVSSNWFDLIHYRDKFYNIIYEEWLDGEVMSYVLREDVFELIDWNDLAVYMYCTIGNMSFLSSQNAHKAMKHLLDSMENQMKTKQFEWKRHKKFCELIENTLAGCYFKNKSIDLASRQTIDQICSYLIKLIQRCQDAETIASAFSAFKQLPADKCQSSILKLIGSIEDQMNIEQCGAEKQGKLCELIKWELKKCKVSYESHDSSNQHFYNQILDYIMKLVETCEDEETIASAIRAFEQFPADKYIFSTLKLIGSIEDQMNIEQCGSEKQGKLCQLIKWELRKCKVLYESQDSSNQHFYNQILDYIMKLVEKCGDEETIECALIVFEKLPCNKYQSEIHKLVDSIECYLNTKLGFWNCQKIFCEIIRKLLKHNRDILNQQTHDRLYDYLRKLIDCCEDENTIDYAWEMLRYHYTEHKQIQTRLYHQSLLQNNLESPQLNLRLHQNWLRILILEWFHYSISDENEKLFWFEYFRKIFHEWVDAKLVLYGIKLLELFCLREYFDTERENVLKKELMGRVQSFDSECPLAHSLPDDFDFDRYQVEWCARWCVHNVMDRDKRGEIEEEDENVLPLIKLSNDGFEARFDRIYCYDFSPVRSQYSVTSGVHFYEVTNATSGKMMFGWSTRDAVLDGYTIVRWNKSRKLICHKDGDYIFLNQSDCHAGDVIGCFIDMDKRRFVFYCNGKEVMLGDRVSQENQEQVIFSSSPYYATAIVSLNQHCYFNFGQASFKFASDDTQLMDFPKVSRNDEMKYMLSKTAVHGYVSDCYWFKHLPVNNHVDLFYRDIAQNECGELVKRVERDIAEGREVEEMKMELGCTRYIQAVIEEMGKGHGGDKVDVMAQWVGSVIEKTIESKSVNSEKILLNLFQLLYPYLHLRINSDIDYIKHRNICIVLSHLNRFFDGFSYDFIDEISDEIYDFLTRTFTETSDEWTQLFVLIALDNFDLNNSGKELILEDTKFIEILNKKGGFKIKNSYSSDCSSLSHQLHFSCEHFLARLNSPPPPRPNPAALNSHDRTSHLKLSLDLFSARSDWTWQSVRSTGRVTKGIYYFEAVLLTNEPMRIGWSTKRTEIERNEVGGDEFSVAFDGYSRTVWHNAQQMQLEMSLERWKARDVVGCLIRENRNRESNEKVKHFCFYLNGHLLSYQAQSPIYSSPHPYHASISLSSHQQVFLNFGQVQFQHPPNEDYLTFIDYSQDVTNQKPQIVNNLNNNKIGNAVITYGKTNYLTNFSMNYPSSLKVDNIPKPEFTFECITCPLCHKNIYLKRFVLDCCTCLKLSMKKPNANQSLLAITSTEQSDQVALSLISSFSSSSSEQLDVNFGDNFKKSTEPKPSTSSTEHKMLKQQNVMLIEEITQCKQKIVELEDEVKTVKAMKFDELINKTNK